MLLRAYWQTFENMWDVLQHPPSPSEQWEQKMQCMARLNVKIYRENPSLSIWHTYTNIPPSPLSVSFRRPCDKFLTI